MQTASPTSQPLNQRENNPKTPKLYPSLKLNNQKPPQRKTSLKHHHKYHPLLLLLHLRISWLTQRLYSPQKPFYKLLLDMRVASLQSMHSLWSSQQPCTPENMIASSHTQDDRCLQTQKILPSGGNSFEPGRQERQDHSSVTQTGV